MTNPIIDAYGTKRWRNDQYQVHNPDGPAVILSDGTKAWCINGERHRTDGPAVIFSNGVKQYWIHDNQLTEEEYYDIIQDEEHLNWYLLKIL